VCVYVCVLIADAWWKGVCVFLCVCVCVLIADAKVCMLMQE